MKKLAGLRLSILAGAALFFLTVSSPSAFAVFTTTTFTVSGTGASSGVPIQATITLGFEDTTGLLQIRIENTSPAATGGAIVGVGFNTPGTRTASSGTVVTQPAGGSMIALNSAGGPYPSGSAGSFDFGVTTTNSNPLQSGDVNQGIGIGEFAEFTFIISDPTGITAFDFRQALNAQGNAVVARFQGIGPGGADSGHATNLPEPSSLLLLGSGLLALGVAARRFRR
jgi:hypothetical protein